jgi:hypothetical protein
MPARRRAEAFNPAQLKVHLNAGAFYSKRQDGILKAGAPR